jgi:hypothetical protein
MNERDIADRFSRDVDSLLSETGRAEIGPATAEYRRVLSLARSLATTDLSAESRVREALRRRLLSQVGVQEMWQPEKRGTPRNLSGRRRWAFGLVTILLAVLFAVALVWPDALAVAAQGIADLVQSLRLGPHTSARQIDPEWAAAHPQDPLPATPEVRYDGDTWIVRTSIGNFAGDLLPGSHTVLRFDTLDEAQSAVGFHLDQLRSLPAGYLLREAMVTPDNWLFQFYDGPHGELVLAQVQVYDHVEQGPGQQIVATARHVGLLTDKPIEEVNIGSQPAGWVAGYGLLWEVDGLSLILGGPNLALEEAICLAESLE